MASNLLTMCADSATLGQHTATEVAHAISIEAQKQFYLAYKSNDKAFMSSFIMSLANEIARMGNIVDSKSVVDELSAMWNAPQTPHEPTPHIVKSLL